MGGYDDYWQIGVFVLQDFEYVQIIGVWYVYVGNQYVGFGVVFVEVVKGFVGVFKIYWLVVFLVECFFQYLVNGVVVVDYLNGCGYDFLFFVVFIGFMGSSRLKQVCLGLFLYLIRFWCWLMIDWVMDSFSFELLVWLLIMG